MPITSRSVVAGRVVHFVDPDRVGRASCLVMTIVRVQAGAVATGIVLDDFTSDRESFAMIGGDLDRTAEVIERKVRRIEDGIDRRRAVPHDATGASKGSYHLIDDCPFSWPGV